jgi:hypothetical protein
MKINGYIFLFGLAVFFNSGFYFQSRTPAELVGKWKLRAAKSKLVGTLEIKNDGKYIYSVVPNYKELGRLNIIQRRERSQIDLVANSGKGKTDITRGIYTIRNRQLELQLGKKDETRPITFTSDSRKGIYWLGTK